jgi:hypothetical protein
VRLHHRKPLDFPKITAEAGFSRHLPTHDLHPLQATSPAKLVSKQNYRLPTPLSI